MIAARRAVPVDALDAGVISRRERNTPQGRALRSPCRPASPTRISRGPFCERFHARLDDQLLEKFVVHAFRVVHATRARRQDLVQTPVQCSDFAVSVPTG
jgi:hypothetical protein